MVASDVSLVGPSVVLRPPTPGDVDAVWEAVTESVLELSRWMAWCHPGYSPEEARAWVHGCVGGWERGEGFEFLVTDRTTGALLGACGLNQIDHLNRRANLGYWVRTRATGRGVATEAAALALHFGIAELELGRIEIVAAVANGASRRVAEKLGATREGVARNRFLLGGDYVDGVQFSLVPADLQTRNRGPGEGVLAPDAS